MPTHVMTLGPQPVLLDARDWAIAAALALALLIASHYQAVVGVSGVYHDDGLYLITAKALATGQGYRIISLPGAPVQTKYPILYPAVLSVVWKAWPVFPDNLAALQLVSMMAGAAALGLAYLYLVRFRYCSRKVALATGVIVATTPLFSYFSTLALSEMPFAFLLVIALWILERKCAEDLKTPALDFGAGVVLALPYLCRTVGLVVPIIAILLIWRAGRRLGWIAVGIAAGVLPWVVWSARAIGAWQKDPITAYYTDYFVDWLSVPASLLTLLSVNVLRILSGTARVAFQGVFVFFSASNHPTITAVLLALSVAAGCLAWTAIFRRRARCSVLSTVLLSYGTVIALWPWPPERFLVPILPLLVAHLLISVPTLFPSARNEWLRPSAGSLVALAIIFNVWCSARFDRQNHVTGYPFAGELDRPVKWSSYQRVFEWLRKNTPPNAIVASGLDSMVYLYADRQAIRPFVHRPLSLFYGDRHPATGTLEEFRSILTASRAGYVILCPLPGFAEEGPFLDLVQSWRAQDPRGSRLAYKDDDPRFMIFAIGNPP